MLGIRTTTRQTFLLMIPKENPCDSNSAQFRELSTTIDRFLADRSHSAHLRAHEKTPSSPLAQGGDSRESAENRASTVSHQRRERWGVEPSLTENDHCAMALGACDPVVKKPTQVLRAACSGVRPKHDDVRKFSVLGPLDRHGEMAALLLQAETRMIAHGFPHKLSDLRIVESCLPMRRAQTVHAAAWQRRARRFGSGDPGSTHMPK